MSDSLLEEIIAYCKGELPELVDSPVRRALSARLGVLERPTWALAVQPATQMQVVGLAKLLLDLRDEVTDARRRQLDAAAQLTRASGARSLL